MSYSLLKQSSAQLETVTKSLEGIALDAAWSKNGYFDATQHDEIERLFFRFLVSRRVLVSLVLLRTKDNGLEPNNNDDDEAKIQHALLERADSSFGDPDTSDDKHTLITLISLAAGLSLFVYEGRLVKAFQRDKVAVSKLNETFSRSDIHGGTFRELCLECTNTRSQGRLKSLQHAYVIFCQESNIDNGSSDHDNNNKPEIDTYLRRLMASNGPAKELADIVSLMYKQARPIAFELNNGGQTMYLPSLGNMTQHTNVAAKARQATGFTKHILREVRAHTFKSVSRIKSPTAHLIRFSDEQKRDVLSRLEPGDIILTYTAGYMSDVFIPGEFKHGITFVGSPEDRAEAGLNAESIAKLQLKHDLLDGESTKLLEHFQFSTIDTAQQKQQQDGDDNGGLAADVIEAVAEGVIFNNLCYVMDTHVNRLLVLRPCISLQERTDALIDIFRYLGAKYDFGFNFANGSAVVCTEIQYHAFSNKGQLDFQLVKHTGHLSISADDIVSYYLTKPGAFEFVLLALEDPDSTEHQAKIYTGDDGREALAALMASA